VKRGGPQSFGPVDSDAGVTQDFLVLIELPMSQTASAHHRNQRGKANSQPAQGRRLDSAINYEIECVAVIFSSRLKERPIT